MPKSDCRIAKSQMKSKSLITLVFGSPCSGKSRFVEHDQTAIFAIPFHKFLDDDVTSTLMMNDFVKFGQVADNKALFISIEKFSRVANDVRGNGHVDLNTYLWCAKEAYINAFEEMLREVQPRTRDEYRLAMIAIYLLAALGQSWEKSDDLCTLISRITKEFRVEQILVYCSGSLDRLCAFERDNWKCKFIIGNPVRRFLCLKGRTVSKRTQHQTWRLRHDFRLAFVLLFQMIREFFLYNLRNLKS